jgi:hypothetical protein
VAHVMPIGVKYSLHRLFLFRLPRSEMRIEGIMSLALVGHLASHPGDPGGQGSRGDLHQHFQAETLDSVMGLFPDERGWLPAMAKLFDTPTLGTLLTHLGYDSPVELLSMCMCLFLVAGPTCRGAAVGATCMDCNQTACAGQLFPAHLSSDCTPAGGLPAQHQPPGSGGHPDVAGDPPRVPHGARCDAMPGRPTPEGGRGGRKLKNGRGASLAGLLGTSSGQHANCFGTSSRQQHCPFAPAPGSRGALVRVACGLSMAHCPGR